MGCFLVHKWNGCKCEKCGKTRNTGHDWQGCKCQKCGAVRDEGHDWQGGIYCSRCNRLANLDNFLPTDFATMPLAQFKRFLGSSASGLISVCCAKKRSFNLLYRFAKGSPPGKEKQEKELQKLLAVTQVLMNLYASRALAEGGDPAKAFDDLLWHYTMHAGAHEGKYAQYGDRKAKAVLCQEMQDYLENI